MTTPQHKALKVKSRGGSMKFKRSWKVLQGEAKKHGDKAVYFKGEGRAKKVHPDDIPF